MELMTPVTPPAMNHLTIPSAPVKSTTQPSCPKMVRKVSISMSVNDGCQMKLDFETPVKGRMSVSICSKGSEESEESAESTVKFSFSNDEQVETLNTAIPDSKTEVKDKTSSAQDIKLEKTPATITEPATSEQASAPPVHVDQKSPKAEPTTTPPNEIASPAPTPTPLPTAVPVPPYVAPPIVVSAVPFAPQRPAAPVPPAPAAAAAAARPVPRVPQTALPLPFNRRQTVDLGDGQGPHQLCCDGSLDKRFKNNTAYPKNGPYIFIAQRQQPRVPPPAAARVRRHNGPRCLNGSLNMSYKVNWGFDKYRD